MTKHRATKIPCAQNECEQATSVECADTLAASPKAAGSSNDARGLATRDCGDEPACEETCTPADKCEAQPVCAPSECEPPVLPTRGMGRRGEAPTH